MKSSHIWLYAMCTFAPLCLYTYMYAHMHTYTHIPTHTRAHTHTHTYVRMHTHTGGSSEHCNVDFLKRLIMTLKHLEEQWEHMSVS